MNAVAVYLRTLRGELGLTQEQAAVGAGFSAKTLERWEAGSHEPTITNLKRIVVALHGSVVEAVYLMLNESTEDDARQTALAWARLSSDERAQIDSLLSVVRSESEIDRLLEGLRSEVPKKQSRIAYLRGLLAGWLSDTSEP